MGIFKDAFKKLAHPDGEDRRAILLGQLAGALRRGDIDGKAQKVTAKLAAAYKNDPAIEECLQYAIQYVADEKGKAPASEFALNISSSAGYGHLAEMARERFETLDIQARGPLVEDQSSAEVTVRLCQRFMRGSVKTPLTNWHDTDGSIDETKPMDAETFIHCLDPR